jgi:hypothetical protein
MIVYVYKSFSGMSFFSQRVTFVTLHFDFCPSRSFAGGAKSGRGWTKKWKSLAKVEEAGPYF